MSQLKLRLDNWLEGEEIASGAVVNLYPIGTEGTPNRRRHPSFAIPAGSGNNFLTVDAEPGRYLIEAKLPSGDVLSKEIAVEPSGPPLEVRLTCDRSPHEWLSWQQFSGKVAERSLYENRRPSPSAQIQLNRPPQPPPAAMLYGVPQLATAAFSSLGYPPDDQSWQWAALAEACRGQQTSFPWLAYKSTLTPRNADEQLQSFVLSASSLGMPIQVPGRGSPELNGGRQLLTMRCGPELELISLPLPWVTFDTWRECPLDIVVRTVIDNPQNSRTSITVRDPSIGAAMSYMTAGSLNRARVIFDQAKEMLFHKSDNPFAAAAGAYALITKQEDSEQDNWHSWVRNLMDWYPWLPDGAIQYGRIKIRDEASDSDIEEAREVLFKAYRRGLPFFSAGIRWLLNGLTIFADDGDDEAREMARNVHRVSLRADMSQPFTVVRIGPRSS